MLMIYLNQYIIKLIIFNFKEHKKDRIYEIYCLDEIMNPDPHETRNLEIFKFTDCKYGFKQHCENRHIEIVKYLCETFKDPKINKVDDYFGFRLVC